MTALVVSEKTCPRCGYTKPLSEFYKNKSNPDGHFYTCKECERTRMKAWTVKRRADMGETAWLTSRVAIQRKHRASDRYTGEPQIAYRNALYELRRRHPDEFVALLRLERHALGLDPNPRGSQ